MVAKYSKIRKWELNYATWIQSPSLFFFFFFQITIPNHTIQWFLPDLYFIWCAKRSVVDFLALFSIFTSLTYARFFHPCNPIFHLVSQLPIKTLVFFLSPMEEINSPFLTAVSVPTRTPAARGISSEKLLCSCSDG